MSTPRNAGPQDRADDQRDRNDNNNARNPNPHAARLYKRPQRLSNVDAPPAAMHISQAVKCAVIARPSATTHASCANSDWQKSCRSAMMIAMPSRTILIGIDEAGYGPILGPLVVSAAAFEVPTSSVEACLWETLKASISPTRSSRKSRIPILDSKKLFCRSQGLAKLERSVLAVLTAWRGLPPTLRGLLGLLCPDLPLKLQDYPWYEVADPPLPREADAGGIRLAASLLRRDLDSHSIGLAGLWSEVLPERHYNRLVNTTQNKAVVLSGLTLRLMQRVADAHPDRELRFAIDKQGAREVYGPLLLRAFEDKRLKVLDERPEHTAY
jgi:hypothetical protein